MVHTAMGIAKLRGLLVDKFEQCQAAADMTPAVLETELAKKRAKLETPERSVGRACNAMFRW